MRQWSEFDSPNSPVRPTICDTRKAGALDSRHQLIILLVLGDTPFQKSCLVGARGQVVEDSQSNHCALAGKAIDLSGSLSADQAIANIPSNRFRVTLEWLA